jgi:Family of unknown function (DUF5330)
MWFLLRVTFWLTVVAVLLPSGGKEGPGNVSAFDAMSAAKATVTDMRSFCERQPDACTIGSQAAVVIGHRAQAGAKKLYEYFNEHLAANEGTPTHGANGKAVPLPPAKPSQHTLTPADMAPAWRGPAPRKDAQRSACLGC